jgi:hypothetical protein
MFRAERLPKTCRVVIPIKFEFLASVGFIHKDKLETFHSAKANGFTAMLGLPNSCANVLSIL